jgi:hypothetical protein
LPVLAQSDWIALGSAFVSLLALFVAVYTVQRSNKASSAATLVTLNDGFRQLWRSYFDAPADRRDQEFFELLNLLEIACGIHCHKGMVGITRELSRGYLEQIVRLVEHNDEARDRFERAVVATTTFKYIARFRARMRRRGTQPFLMRGLS